MTAQKAEVIPFPIWKRGASAAERFEELALMARAQPERFSEVIVIYKESHEEGFSVREVSSGLSTMEAIGLLEMGKLHVWEHA